VSVRERAGAAWFLLLTDRRGAPMGAAGRTAATSSGPSAENIAWGYRTPPEVVTGWMNSPGHRANIVNRSSVAVGVGMVRAADGSPYWTQDFGRI
jgi:uncharacterized protein YkwD